MCNTLSSNVFENQLLADLLFPETDKSIEQIKSLYPQRNLTEGAMVTRFAPSPTGFLHIGGLFTALINYLTAKKSNGTFFVRIEDTDKKREIYDGVSEILSGLKTFGINADEGAVDFNKESGSYGPYVQSLRRKIYNVFAKELVLKGLAYPCFCSAEDLAGTRAKQESQKITTGYYGEYAVCRKLNFEEIKNKINNKIPFILRLHAPDEPDKKIAFKDVIKGKIEFPVNNQDIVLLKTDGIPTYHLAHIVDDYLMGTTHVLRGDEWLSSTPIHLQLFFMLSLKPPKYAHIAPIMKEENGGKRKLSKRKDPEASVSYYKELGYPKESVIEYLLTIANSNFEDWRKINPLSDNFNFDLKLAKMSVSGALFDLVKLADVSRNVIGIMPAAKVAELSIQWAKEFDSELFELLNKDKSFTENIFSIDRNPKKPRKDISCWSDVRNFLSYFFDEIFDGTFNLPENINKNDAINIIKQYISVYNESDDKNTWFMKIKELCEPNGFSPDVKAYKKDPEAFKGHVGDLSTIIRVAVTGRTNTPDLHTIMQLLGKECILSRMNNFLNILGGN